MKRRTAALVLVALAGLVAVGPTVAHTGAAGGTTLENAQQTDTPDVVSGCAADPPADFADPGGTSADTVGWVEGYWYDEPVDVDISDGVTQDELNRLAARTAARFEAIRCLTVQSGLPPVEVVTREEFAERQDDQYADIGTASRLFDNAMFETMLAIDSETDSVDVRQSDAAERVGGSYNFVEKKILVVSDDPDNLSIDESTLAHELGHAIQDQQFNISSYERPTVDRDKGVLGLIEGDVDSVRQTYLEACEAGEWDQPCLTDQRPGAPDIANWGLYFTQIQPYSDGPSFVEGIRAEQGWEGVNALYEDPPTTALHTAVPETYGEVAPLDVEVPDRSTAAWERIVIEDVPTVDGPVTHETLGISALTGMFAAPAWESDTFETVIEQQDTVNQNPLGGIDQSDPHEFVHPETEGWRGDTLYTYRNESNETATVWRLAWNSSEDAEPFVDGYEKLIDIRGGQPVEGLESTYTFGPDSGYDSAVTLVTDGDRVTVVTAPTVDALTAVDQELALTQNNETDNGTDDNGDGDNNDGPGDNDTESPDDENRTDDDGNGTTGNETADGTGPGFSIVAALLALVAGLVVARGR